MRWKVAAICLAGALVCQAAAAQDAPERRYRLKELTLDSHIPYEYARGVGYPLDRAYKRFTEREKQAFKDFYEPMLPDDEPPFPAEGLKPVIQKLSRLVGLLKIEGEVVLHITINAQGEATGFKVFRATNPQVVEAVAKVFAQTPFKPAVCDGQPCEMDFPFTAKLGG